MAGDEAVAEGAAPPCRRRGGRQGPLYVVEHLEEGLEQWCRLEYRHICKVVPPERVLFLHFPTDVDAAALAPDEGASAGKPPPHTAAQSLEDIRSMSSEEASGVAVAGLLPSWDRVCLLDMEAEEALDPADATRFGAFVFGGILGNIDVRPDGSYGSDDRTSEVRRLGFQHRRHLGPMQMTTDTAVLVSQLVLEEARPLAEIPFLDSPEIGGSGTEEAGASDCICMEGFRYVARRDKSGEWEPTLPEGMAELLVSSADNDILDSL